MRILSFAFDGEPDNLYLPQNIEKNSICYTGTHDNDTLMGLLESLPHREYQTLVTGVIKSLKVLGIKRQVSDDVTLAKAIIELGFACKADTFIIPMQDACLLKGEFRMNTPGSELSNWSVKIPKECFSVKTSSMLKRLTTKYKRL